MNMLWYQSKSQPEGSQNRGVGAAGIRQPLSRGPGVLPRVAGVAIILGCIALPIILGVLATATEEAAAHLAIQQVVGASDAFDSARSSTTNMPIQARQVASQERPRLFDQHYYMVNGCVSTPLGCDDTTPGNWGEYYLYLGRLYDEAVASVTGVSRAEPPPSFDAWAADHVHLITVQTAADGAYQIERALPQNTSGSDIHMIGTSAGGAAIVSYLGRAMRAEVALDRRVRTAIAVDSPLGFQFPFRSSDVVLGIEAGVMKSDVELGIGAWARAINVTLFTVDTPRDIVGHEPISYVMDDSDPIYPGESLPPAPNILDCDGLSLPCVPFNVAQWLVLGSNWHAYTGGHMSESVEQFMDEHWR